MPASTCLKSLIFLGHFWAGTSLFAESHALIATGLAGSAANEEEFTRLAGETKRLLVERGIPLANIESIGGKITRETILAKLSEVSAAQKPEDEFWFIFYGHAGRSQGNLPALQVSGPRLTASDLQVALDAIPARQFVFIGANASGGFLSYLMNARRVAVSATKGDSESDQPRFPNKWVIAFSENPKAAFSAIAARAAVLVDEEYKTSQLAQTEHARLADPVTGKILEPPFGVNLLSAIENPSVSSGGTSLLSASDIKIKVLDPKAEWEKQPSTDATRALIATAKAVPNPDGHSALLLEQRIGFTVEEDRSTERFSFQRVYLAREEAVEEWANHFLQQLPPAVTTKLEIARVIQPDGSSTVFNPAKLSGVTDPDSGESTSMAMVYLPNAHAGCVIEIGWRTHEILNATLPYVSEMIPIQSGVPALKTQIEVRLPVKPVFRVRLQNKGEEPTETQENGRRILRWTLENLPAAEALPGDPPWTQWAVWLGVSSLPSWEDFAIWYRRIAQGSEAIDDGVRKMSADLMATALTRDEKLRRCYEFVAAFRYVAIELGVQGFRPRTPAQVLANRYGDCKDKANLLIALLRCQGIAAKFVLLNRGGATDVNFPSWQFNHAIAYVPAAPNEGQPGDLWMDATDGVTPFGFVAPGDFGRAGLVFSGEKTEFKIIANHEKSVSRIEDKFDLQWTQIGGWTGTFQRQATGLAEDELRWIFRGLTPLQKRLRIYQLADQLWAGADFSAGAVSDVSELREPVKLSAKVVSKKSALPPANFAWLELFAAPERDRPLLVNNGQPCIGVQTIQARSQPGELPKTWSATAGGFKFSIDWKQLDASTAERVAMVEIQNSTVPTTDYPAIRRLLKDWQHEMQKLPH